MRRSGDLAGTLRERVAAIFAFMHQRVLRGGYDLAYTDLRRVLDEGRFNYISASVLFNYLAGEVGSGLPRIGDAGPRHEPRPCWPDGPVDVETTCRNGLFLNAMARITQLRVLPLHAERADYTGSPHRGACASI